LQESCSKEPVDKRVKIEEDANNTSTRMKEAKGPTRLEVFYSTSMSIGSFLISFKHLMETSIKIFWEIE
jgi:hypothetical protein